METTDIDYDVDGIAYRGRLISPARTQAGPAVLVVHEAPGLSSSMYEVAARLADQGYTAFAIDYVGAGKQLAPMPKVIQQIAAWTADPGPLQRICAVALRHLVAAPYVDPSRIAGFGYCFGAQVLLEYARTGAELRMIHGFHPGLGAPRPAQSAAIRASLSMYVGAEDPIATADHRRQFEDEMTGAGVDWQMTVYGGVSHAFTNPDVDSRGIPGFVYEAAAAEDAWATAMRSLSKI